MKDGGLTEKKMANRRFSKTERAIFVAYCKLRDYPSSKKIAQYAGISRTTLYRHHRRVAKIPEDYEDYLLKNYYKTMRGFVKNGTKIRILYLRTLIFIMNNKEIILALFQEDKKEIIKGMVDFLKPCILNEWKMGGDLSKMFNIYKNEIVGVVEAWAGKKFSDKELDAVLEDIIYLTHTARRRLLPLK